MFEGLHDPRGGDGSGYERDADGFERFRWQMLGGKPGPETVTVASDGYKACDSVVTNKVIDFSTLNVGGAMISRPDPGIESRVCLTGPIFDQAAREILWVGAHVERGHRITPDFPCGLRLFQLFQKPGLLFGSENGRGRLTFAKIGNFLITEPDRCRRMAAVICTSGIEDFEGLLRHQSRKVVAHQSTGFGPIRGFLRAVTALVSNDEVDISPPSHRPIAAEAVNGGQVVWFQTEAMLVKPGDRNIGDARWIELRQRRSARFEQSCRLVFEESLIGSYLASLPGVIHSAEVLQALPPDPTELVIVPHADKRPTRPRIL